MRYFTLISILCLISIALSTPTNATFELEDPADPDQQLEMEKKQKSFFKSTGKRYDVIIAAGTDLYIPNIDGKACDGWILDKTEPWIDENDEAHYNTNKTYMGLSMKTIDCARGDDKLKLSLIKTDQGRLVWVESDKVLAVD